MSDDFDFDYFDPKELAVTLEPGTATFRIVQVLPKISKNGNAMLELMFSVTDSKGQKGNVFDWLVTTPGDEPGMKRLATKIFNIANAIGKPEVYENRSLKPVDLLGEQGRCELKTQKSENYPDKTVISKFMDKTKILDGAAKQAAIPDDEMNF